MAIFEGPNAGGYPKQWKDMSLELKLMFVYHGCMMALFVIGGTFSLLQELTFTAMLLAVLASVSMRHRRSANWRWQGITAKNLVSVAANAALMGILLYAATPLFPPSNPRFLPWYLAGFGIGTFNVLQALRFVHPSEAAFLADCHERTSQVDPWAQIEPSDPLWHRIVRATFSIAFLIVWLEFAVFFYYSGKAFRDGSSVPTPAKSEAVTEHGKTDYIARDQKILWDRLESFAFTGIPSVIVSSFLLHFLVGVKLFPNTPTLRELLARNRNAAG